MYPINTWLRAYTTTLHSPTSPIILGQVIRYGKITTAHGDEQTVTLKNAVWQCEVMVSDIIEESPLCAFCRQPMIMDSDTQSLFCTCEQSKEFLNSFVPFPDMTEDEEWDELQDFINSMVLG